MKLWLCRNCMVVNENGVPVVGRRFEADLPVCPNCGCDRSNPRHATYIGEVELIHFDAPDPVLNGFLREERVPEILVFFGTKRDRVIGKRHVDV